MSQGPVRVGFEKALANARRQKIIFARHEGTIAAARALADKIDQWDVIVQWAVEDKEDFGLMRPAVPQNDNTSLPTFLKYMDALGLTVAADPVVIFDTPIEQRYDRALALLGLQAWMLSPDAGHA